MEYVELGRSGLKVSVMGLGTWQWGSRGWGWGSDYGVAQAVEAFHRALDLGINFIDTAEVYGDGLSEEIVGQAIQSRRDEVVVATKVSPAHISYGGVLKAAERSLRRLKVEAIDLYQVHWPNPLIPIRRTMKVMERLVKEGKARHIGVSNFSLPLLKRAQESLSFTEVVSNQIRYNLLQREAEEEMLPYARRERVSVIAYSPLAQGILTGKYSPGSPPRGWVRALNPLFTPENLRRAAPILTALREIALSRGKTIPQVALNWLVKDPLVVAIPGAKNALQVEENAGASGWRLTEPEVSRIGGACASFKPERAKSYVTIAFNLLTRPLKRH